MIHRLFPDELRMLLDSTQNLLVRVRDREIQWAAYECERMFRCPVRGGMSGMKVEELIPDRDGLRTRHVEHMKSYALAPLPRCTAMAPVIDVFGLRFDGTEFRLVISLHPIQFKAGDLMALARCFQVDPHDA